ncbi:uncharacterized protein KGF55_000223 [Candida pseudojiufengensis]|uniref:uncharacterized protein n=1 Tax=Candida pseudojiufengensis TaxID=497109 RepID=UPI0022255F4A|nr:uncharacterized protein KGF55_000223 [Candida pseudojiufengensis]KAI5966814.1 hypothetical protein KGF55_000223 [Candida pseudojiufengensis]
MGKSKEPFSIENYEILPGTVHLVDIGQNLNVKKAGDGDIILHPQPTNNPNDPLTWSKGKRAFQFSLIWFWGFMVAGSFNFMGPLYTAWIEDFGVTLNQILIGSGLGFLFLGTGVTIIQPTGLKLGKQFVYNVCTILSIVACAFGSQTKDIAYFYAFKIVIGLAASPVDSLVEISSTDMFFQHERSTAISWLVMALYGGSDLFPVAAGYIADSMHWSWTYYVQIMIYVPLLIVQIFFMEDSTFRRGGSKNNEDSLEEGILKQIKSNETNEQVATSEDSKEQVEIEVASVNSSELPKRTYWENRNWVHREYNDKRSWFQIFLRPFTLITFPAVVWGGIIYGGQMCWISLIVNLQAAIYSNPPYNFSVGIVGLTTLGMFFGNVVGMFYGGPFIDWLAVKLARRNHGILEPEHRLHAMLVPTVLNAAGVLAFGLGAYYGSHWTISVVIGMGFMGFAMTSSGSCSLVYAVECYGKLGSECIVLMLFIRNMIGMAFTFGIGPWMDAAGTYTTTWLMFMLSLIINGSYLILIFWGKTFRRWTKDRYERMTVGLVAH